MSEKILIVDIDETLVYSREQMSDSVAVDWEGTTDYTKARPGAHDFLAAAKAEGWTIISVTQGVVPFQEAVLEAVGMLHYFKDIYGWTSVHRNNVKRPNLSSDDKWVMVDNLHYTYLAEKENWIGASFNPLINFVQCDEYRGGVTTCLTTLLPRIKELFDD